MAFLVIMEKLVVHRDTDKVAAEQICGNYAKKNPGSDVVMVEEILQYRAEVLPPAKWVWLNNVWQRDIKG